MAASAASFAAGQVSDCQMGMEGDFPFAPPAVEELLPVVPLPSEVMPTPEAAGPVVLVRAELVAVVRGAVLFFKVGDWPAPFPVPFALRLVVSVLWPRVGLVAASVVLPAPGRPRSSPPG